jgi:hypothetical protein
MRISVLNACTVHARMQISHVSVSKLRGTLLVRSSPSTLPFFFSHTTQFSPKSVQSEWDGGRGGGRGRRVELYEQLVSGLSQRDLYDIENWSCPTILALFLPPPPPSSFTRHTCTTIVTNQASSLSFYFIVISWGFQNITARISYCNSCAKNWKLSLYIDSSQLLLEMVPCLSKSCLLR